MNLNVFYVMHSIVFKRKIVLVCRFFFKIFFFTKIFQSIKLGSATACVLGIDCNTGQLHSVNIGDSGYVVVRNKRVVYRSRSQKMNGDCPRQLDVYPWTASLKRKGLNYTQIS